MDTHRLNVLADYLEKEVMNEEFNLGEWKCGSCMCAVGHACFIPEFAADGLSMKGIEKFYPSYKGYDGCHAVEAFFDLDENEAPELFSMYAYPGKALTTKEEVAARIRETVKKEWI